MNDSSNYNSYSDHIFSSELIDEHTFTTDFSQEDYPVFSDADVSTSYYDPQDSLRAFGDWTLTQSDAYPQRPTQQHIASRFPSHLPQTAYGDISGHSSSHPHAPPWTPEQRYANHGVAGSTLGGRPEPQGPARPVDNHLHGGRYPSARNTFWTPSSMSVWTEPHVPSTTSHCSAQPWTQARHANTNTNTSYHPSTFSDSVQPLPSQQIPHAQYRNGAHSAQHYSNVMYFRDIYPTDPNQHSYSTYTNMSALPTDSASHQSFPRSSTGTPTNQWHYADPQHASHNASHMPNQKQNDTAPVYIQRRDNALPYHGRHMTVSSQQVYPSRPSPPHHPPDDNRQYTNAPLRPSHRANATQYNISGATSSQNETLPPRRPAKELLIRNPPPPRPPEPVRPVECPYCSRKFRNNSELKRHTDQMHDTATVHYRYTECVERGKREPFENVKDYRVREHCRDRHGQARGRERYRKFDGPRSTDPHRRTNKPKTS